MRHVPKEIKLYLTGPHYAYLDEYASENCIFLGYVSKNDQFGVMSQADVLVCTADQDCNAKLHEYLRWEKPILGYDGRANLLFKNGRNALLTRDYPSAIMRLYNEPQLRRELAEHAKPTSPCIRTEIARSLMPIFERHWLRLDLTGARRAGQRDRPLIRHRFLE